MSPPDPNGAWREGKTVEVTVTFNELVKVKTNGGTPTIGIKLDQSRNRQAPYVRGTDTHEMVFAYQLAGRGRRHEPHRGQTEQPQPKRR